METKRLEKVSIFICQNHQKLGQYHLRRRGFPDLCVAIFQPPRHKKPSQPNGGVHPALIELNQMGISGAGVEFMPPELFGIEALTQPKTLVLLALGGFLIGFGTRYAGGCTSGHAISGLSDLQWPSFVAVIGFFVGGLLMNHLILPYIL